MEPATRRPGTVEIRMMAAYPSFEPVGRLTFNTVQQQETFLRILTTGVRETGVQCHVDDGSADVTVTITTPI